MKRLIRVFFVLIFFTCCNFERVPPGIIKKDEMIQLLTDMHAVDEYTALQELDTTKKYINLYISVFNKYQTNYVQYRKSLIYYSRKPKEFQAMYVVVQSNLDAKRESLVKKSEEKAKIQK